MVLRTASFRSAEPAAEPTVLRLIPIQLSRAVHHGAEAIRASDHPSSQACSTPENARYRLDAPPFHPAALVFVCSKQLSDAVPVRSMHLASASIAVPTSFDRYRRTHIARDRMCRNYCYQFSLLVLSAAKWGHGKHRIS